MSSVSSGVRHLTGVRIVKAVGGLLTHALLCSYFGIEGYGILGIAIGILGLLKVVGLNTASALQTLTPLLQAEGAGDQARRLSWFAYGANAILSVVSSAVLVAAGGTLSGGNPLLADALLALAVWNLLPVLRGPVDPDLMMGLRWYRPLLTFRALEQSGAVMAAAAVWVAGADQAGYFLWLAFLSSPTVLLSLALVPRWRRTLTGSAESPTGSFRRILRYCVPVTLSQALYRVYLNVGAPLLGAMLSVSAAGLYKFALNIAEMATEFLATIPQAYHPELARARATSREKVVRLYREAVDMTLAVTAPAALVLMVCSGWIAALLSRGKFVEAGPLLAIMAFQVFLRTVATPATRVLIVHERTLTAFAVSAGKLALELTALFILIGPFGATGAVGAHVAAAVPTAAVLFLLARRTLGAGAGGVTLSLARGLALLTAFWIVLLALDHWMGPVPGLRLALFAAVLAYTVFRLTHRMRGAPSEALIRDGVFRGLPLLGGSPAQPGAPITLITNSRAEGGVEHHVEDLARNLGSRRIAFDLLCPESSAIEGWVQRMKEAGAREVVRVGVAAPWDVAGMWRTFRALHRTRGILHFHLNSPDDLAPGLLLATVAGRRPILATLHLSRKDRPPFLSPKAIRRRLSLPMPDRIIAVAEDLRRELIEDHGRDPEGVVTVQNGIHPGRFAVRPGEREAARRELGVTGDEFVLLFVGRLTRVKGVDVLLEALAGLDVRSGAAPVTFVVGDGPLRGELEARAADHRLDVRFVGWQDEIKPFLAAADGFVLPSHYEGLPLSVAEAMAAEVPVIATAVCGTPEIVADGVTGFLVPPGNPPALGEALDRLIKKTPAARRQMGAAGRERVRSRFEADRKTAEVVSIYADLDPAVETERTTTRKSRRDEGAVHDPHPVELETECHACAVR
jgi:glycosyltransferase involved in cell wall biosynthesis